MFCCFKPFFKKYFSKYNLIQNDYQNTKESLLIVQADNLLNNNIENNKNIYWYNYPIIDNNIQNYY